ncbi:MAG: 3-phosphoshikimate 1-carboxyvinyltransferase [Betaproteobacteria bacterium]|nr:3-phosphoshikimate 1-carboxyvinyltransferase [Betaproteobacteria bacterium]
MKCITLAPIARCAGTVRLPGSKSISNRVLLLAALAKGKTQVHGLLDAEDTRLMLTALQQLDIPIDTRDYSRLVVTGAGGIPKKKEDLFLGNAGTAFRPLTAALALSGGEYRLSGKPRMHERPIGDLVAPLRRIGARIDYAGNEGFPPLAIHPGSIRIDGPILLRGNVSSQYLSALLMALPLAGGGTVEMVGELISKPYVTITLNMMRKFGNQVRVNGWQSFEVPGVAYVAPPEIHVEGDASSASYFLAAGAIAGGPVRVIGVGRDSIQGDLRFAEVLEKMGARVEFGPDWIEVSSNARLKPIDMDLNHIPDAAMTAAVAALFADGQSSIRNIGSWQVKETDRITAMATELRKLGANVIAGPDFLTITPPAKLNPGIAIDTYDDHRMAMCFSLVALGEVPVTINDPDCVAKTFPAYFTVLNSIAKL